MTALGKLLRTTAFKLTLVYLTIFVLFAAVVLVYFAWNTRAAHQRADHPDGRRRNQDAARAV